MISPTVETMLALQHNMMFIYNVKRSTIPAIKWNTELMTPNYTCLSRNSVKIQSTFEIKPNHRTFSSNNTQQSRMENFSHDKIYDTSENTQQTISLKMAVRKTHKPITHILDAEWNWARVSHATRTVLSKKATGRAKKAVLLCVLVLDATKAIFSRCLVNMYLCAFFLGGKNTRFLFPTLTLASGPCARMRAHLHTHSRCNVSDLPFYSPLSFAARSLLQRMQRGLIGEV